MRLLITRPHDQAIGTASLLRDDGHEPVIEPLLRVEPLEGEFPAGPYVGAIVTSINAVPALAGSPYPKSDPVFAVGEKTASALDGKGFSSVCTGHGDIDSLVNLVANAAAADEDHPFLYPCAQQTARDLPALLSQRGLSCRPWLVYRTVPVPRFTEETARALRQGEFDGVLLYSPKTARRFSQLFDQLDARAPVPASYVLSEAIRDALSPRFRSACHVAAEPHERALRFLLT